MTLLCSLLEDTPGAADLNRQLLALGVADKLARCLFDVLCRAGGFVDGLADLLPLPVADLLRGLVALLNRLVEGLLLEGDLALLLEVLLADLLLGGRELGHVGEVALLGVLVRALQNGLLFEAGDLFQLVDAAEAGLWVVDTGAEVNACRGSRRLAALLPALAAELTAGAAPTGVAVAADKVAHNQAHQAGQ